MAAWKSALPLLVAVALIIFEERASVPSCEVVSVDRRDNSEIGKNDDDLTVMMVADLLLTGSDAGYVNLFFRDPYMAKFLKKSYKRLKPDMLVVLGDVSANGSELTSNKWISVLQQLQRILGPFLGLPLHIVLGDREVGDCSKMNPKSVHRMASSLPGLDSSGCGAFEVSNISFVSLNSVTMLCSNSMRFGVEGVIERESLDLRKHDNEITGALYEPDNWRDDLEHFQWRENAASSGSGPVLLLHLPLYRTSWMCSQTNAPVAKLGDKKDHWSSGKTEHRIVFSAHTHHFCEHIHKDGTREVTVPATAWYARDDPGFVVVKFGQGNAMTVSRCSLTRESHVIMAYASVLYRFNSITTKDLKVPRCRYQAFSLQDLMFALGLEFRR
ncbi:hypothetical protein ACLOJK_013247 [Asimina triloba]